MRLRAEIWVKAYVRTCSVAAVPAVVVKHGDDDAGAVYIKVTRRDGTARLFGPAPVGLDGPVDGQRWVAHLDGPDVTEHKVDQFLREQTRFDPDLWVVEIEDPKGRHFLGDWLLRSGPIGGDD